MFVNRFPATRNRGFLSQTLKTWRWKLYIHPESRPASDTRILASPCPKVNERDQLLVHFIDSFCPSGIEKLAQTERSHHYWVHFLPGLHGRSSILDIAMSTLAAAYLGQRKGDYQLQRHGMLLYEKALKQLSQITAVANFRANDYTLASIMCLGMSEVRCGDT